LFFTTYSQVTVSYTLVKPKFIYAGVDNLVTIEGLNQLSKPHVTVIRAIIRKEEDQLYYINPVEADSCRVIIRDLLGNQINFSIPVKPTPDPDPFLNNILGSGVYSSSEIKATDSLTLTIKNFDWDISFEIDSFKVTRISNQTIESTTNIGAPYNNTTKEIINKALSGDIYIFDTIFYSKAYKKTQLDKCIVVRVL